MHVIEGRIVGRGHNRRVQKAITILHAEMDYFENEGRLPAMDYLRATLYSTLPTCDMCSGTSLLYKIPRIVIGENVSIQGPEDYLRIRDIKLTIVNDTVCIELPSNFMTNPDRRLSGTLMYNLIKEYPALWNEDIGEE